MSSAEEVSDIGCQAPGVTEEVDVGGVNIFRGPGVFARAVVTGELTSRQVGLLGGSRDLIDLVRRVEVGEFQSREAMAEAEKVITALAHSAIRFAPPDVVAAELEDVLGVKSDRSNAVYAECGFSPDSAVGGSRSRKAGYQMSASLGEIFDSFAQSELLVPKDLQQELQKEKETVLADAEKRAKHIKPEAAVRNALRDWANSQGKGRDLYSYYVRMMEEQGLSPLDRIAFGTLESTSTGSKTVEQAFAEIKKRGLRPGSRVKLAKGYRHDGLSKLSTLTIKKITPRGHITIQGAPTTGIGAYAYELVW